MSIIQLSEYNENKGGVCYFTQNKFGSEWFNKVDNSKGWTVDFKLRVDDVQNSNLLVDENKKGKGSGLYINDGKYEEIINFLTQEIIFYHSDESTVYDTTVFNNYRVTGKDKNLKLYAKEEGKSSYVELANIELKKKVTPNGNALKPCIFEDASGILHAAWYDDGGGFARIYYSKFSNNVWSEPENIMEGKEYSFSNPSILVNASGIVYIVFEYNIAEGSQIALVYKNDVGWSDPYITGNISTSSKNPKATFDSNSNVCVVWENYTNVHPDIYYDSFLVKDLKWKGSVKLSNDTFGSYHPSISSYLDNIYISWTSKDEEGESLIKAIIYYAMSGKKGTIAEVCNDFLHADYSCILASVSGKIFIVWQDDISGRYQIYAKVLTVDLLVLQSETNIVIGNGGSKYPVLSEHLSTGNIYIVWQDYKTYYKEEFSERNEPDTATLSPYFDTDVQVKEPNDGVIFVAVYSNGIFYSSGAGSFDVLLTFNDDRNCYRPAVPTFFTEELPIVYESYAFDEYGFVSNDNLLLKVYCAFYNLSRELNYFLVNVGTINDHNGRERDYLLNSNFSTKEIRFGDFSDVVNSHYVFQNMKYYLSGPVEPYSVKEIKASAFNINNLSSSDAFVNNYGDVWFVGPCGIYFYVNSQNRLIPIGPDEEILGLYTVNSDSSQAEKDIEIDTLRKFKTIAFDQYNNMFIGGENGLFRYSTNHIKGFKNLSLPGLPPNTTIKSILFNKQNTMFVGTNNGLYVYDNIIIENNSGEDLGNITISTTDNYSNFFSLENYPLKQINCLQIDANDCLWIGTVSGLYRYFKNKFLFFSTGNGLPSIIINDIAIRNTAIRYIATSNGIAKMVGFNFDKVINSEDDSIWNNNVKSVMWKKPNMLFAGTMSQVNQIMVDDDNDIYSSFIYEPNYNINNDPNDFSVYYFTGENNDITEGDILDIYVNGNFIPHGYTVGYDKNIIKFDTSLNHNDIVEAILRKDLKLIYSFSSGTNGKDLDNNLYRIKDISTITDKIYVSVEGDTQELKINDSSSILPYDKINLDTAPPTILSTGTGIKITEQINKSLVRVSIDGATDDIVDGNTIIVGSGIEKMVISNYNNFTTDGFTSQTPTLYSSTSLHDLGLSLDNVTKELEFSSGKGSKISYFSSSNELFAGSSQPAALYQYSYSNQEWEKIYDYDETEYIDFIEKYNNYIIVSVGSDDEVAKLHIYTDAGGILTLFQIIPLSESRGWCSYTHNGKIYIGSGIGTGNAYTSGVGDGGAVYLFNDGVEENVDPYVDKIVDTIDNDIYSMTNSSGNNLLVSTGESGYIYEVDIDNESAFIVYNSTEPLTAINTVSMSSTSYIFTGGKNLGKIRRSISGANSYNISFSTIAGKVSSLKRFRIDISANAEETLYTAIGKYLYYLSKNGTWIWRYSHTENINDITYDENKGYLYLISDNFIVRLDPILQSKTVYLKLIDRAGNETIYNKSLSEEENKFSDSISISNLTNFVNSNQIFQLDANGNIVYTLSSDNRFYSANKIEEERGEYVSEIFDGTNDLVKWETMTWEATIFNDTSVEIYVRTSSSKSSILLVDWIGPYYNYQCGGVDLSAFSGQYMQFKAVLKSSQKSISPVFKRATIRAIAGESIHFFTTNFVIDDTIKKGILTSEKVVPVSADIVFGINTTNSVDWNDYQPVDENRIFTVNQSGTNLRVGIKLLSPNRSLVEPSPFDEYGPYNSYLFINTIDFSINNDTGDVETYNFVVTLYTDYDLKNLVYTADTRDSVDGFSADGKAISTSGLVLNNGDTSDILFSVPASANLSCNEYYFVKIEYIYDSTSFTYSDDCSFISSCTSSFIDNIHFDFKNNEAVSAYYHFRIKFYKDPERTMEYKTVFSGNSGEGWSYDSGQEIPEEGLLTLAGDSHAILYSPDPDDFEKSVIYYLTIEAHDGTDYVFSLNFYSFQVRDVISLEYCGEYMDVPIVKNFSLMFELDNNKFVTLNI